MKDIYETDPIWEQKYSLGHSERYPWDHIVSFVFRYCPAGKPRKEVKILEVGCGTGSNLWFAAREGFQVTGIDASPSAIDTAIKRFSEEKHTGNFHIGSFAELPFDDNTFDIVIDRCAITCSGFTVAKKTFEEIRRVLQKKGRFHFNPYGKKHTSYISGKPGPDGIINNIYGGTLIGAGQICFYSRNEIDSFFSNGWQLLSIKRVELITESEPDRSVHEEWRVIAEKV